MRQIACPLLGITGAILLSTGLSCQDSRETNSLVPEPQETVIVSAEKPDDSVRGDASEAVREIPRESVSPESTGGTENNQAEMPTQSSGDRKIALGGRFGVTVPGHWVARPPAVSLIEHEFAVPTSEEGKPDGRVTLMAARGGVNANIERWVKQFRFPNGRNESGAIIREQRDIAGQKVHLVDISGTYLESSGPMMERIIEREDYRMLGAVIECQDGFLYFVKFYGPQKTVSENKVAFMKMIESLRTLDSQ